VYGARFAASRAEPIGSMADAERSLKLLAELEKLLAELEAQPSAAQARASFQKACGPSQPM